MKLICGRRDFRENAWSEIRKSGDHRWRAKMRIVVNGAKMASDKPLLEIGIGSRLKEDG